MEAKGAMIYHVSMKMIPWDRFEVMGGPAPQPTPHCVGCLMVFDNEATAYVWGDGNVVKIQTKTEAEAPESHEQPGKNNE